MRLRRINGRLVYVFAVLFLLVFLFVLSLSLLLCRRSCALCGCSLFFFLGGSTLACYHDDDYAGSSYIFHCLPTFPRCHFFFFLERVHFGDDVALLRLLPVLFRLRVLAAAPRLRLWEGGGGIRWSAPTEAHCPRAVSINRSDFCFFFAPFFMFGVLTRSLLVGRVEMDAGWKVL